MNVTKIETRYRAVLKSAFNETLHIDAQHRYLQQALHCLITLIQHALSKTIVNIPLLMHQQTELMYVLRPCSKPELQGLKI